MQWENQRYTLDMKHIRLVIYAKNIYENGIVKAYAFCICKTNISFFLYRIYNNLSTRKAVKSCSKLKRIIPKSVNTWMI